MRAGSAGGGTSGRRSRRPEGHQDGGGGAAAGMVGAGRSPPPPARRERASRAAASGRRAPRSRWHRGGDAHAPGRGWAGSEFPPRPGLGGAILWRWSCGGEGRELGLHRETQQGTGGVCSQCGSFLMSEGGRVKSFFVPFEAVREDACCVHCTGRASCQSSLQVARAG